MSQEIERRFYLYDPAWRPEGVQPVRLDQGYFSLGKTARGLLELNEDGYGRFVLRQMGEGVGEQGGAELLSFDLPIDQIINLWHSCETLHAGLAEFPMGWKARIRLQGENAYVFDLKGPRTGTTRVEIGPIELQPDHGLKLLELTGDTRLTKLRYRTDYAGYTWEIDVYEGKYKGLVTAEVELEADNALIDLPPWVGEEITHRKVFT